MVDGFTLSTQRLILPCMLSPLWDDVCWRVQMQPMVSHYSLQTRKKPCPSPGSPPTIVPSANSATWQLISIHIHSAFTQLLPQLLLIVPLKNNGMLVSWSAAYEWYILLDIGNTIQSSCLCKLEHHSCYTLFIYMTYIHTHINIFLSFSEHIQIWYAHDKMCQYIQHATFIRTRKNLEKSAGLPENCTNIMMISQIIQYSNRLRSFHVRVFQYRSNDRYMFLLSSTVTTPCPWCSHSVSYIYCRCITEYGKSGWEVTFHIEQYMPNSNQKCDV